MMDSSIAQRNKKIVKAISESKAKLVFVALGVPKQEQWISEKLSHLDGVVAIGIGGSFDVLAGNIPRAPGMDDNAIVSNGCIDIFRTSTDWPHVGYSEVYVDRY